MPANTKKAANAQYDSKWFDGLGKTANHKKGQHVSDLQLAVALRKTYGNRSRAASLVGVEPSTVYLRVSNSEALQRVMREAAEQTMDLAEDVNLQSLRRGDDHTAKWLLTNMRAAKDRGYGTSTEFSLSPADIAALAAAFSGNPQALRDLETTLDTEAPAEQGAPEADDRDRAARRPSKRTGRRG